MRKQQLACIEVEIADAECELEAATKALSDHDLDDPMALRESVLEFQILAGRARAQLMETLERLREGAGDPGGLSVADSADYLGVSPPTVRLWIERGLLQAVPDAKPVQVQTESARRVRQVLGVLRERGQDKDWLRSLVDYLHDRRELNDPSLLEGLEDMRAGRLEPA